jgi:hypothetical protein
VFAAAGALVTGCGQSPGRRLCDAIAKRDVAAVHRVLDGLDIDLQKEQETCLPVAAVFANAKAADTALTEIGVELVKAGLPATASWQPHDGTGRITAVEAAAANGNAGLVRALAAVGLDFASPEATRAFVKAAHAGHLPVVRLMVQEGVPLEPLMPPEEDADTLATQALARGHQDVAAFLQETMQARAIARAAAEAAAEARAADEAAARARAEEAEKAADPP